MPVLVSVPFRGLYFLNPVLRIWDAVEKGFRPLSGTVFPKNEKKLLKAVGEDRFRPLSGTVFPKLDKDTFDRVMSALVSVP